MSGQGCLPQRSSGEEAQIPATKVFEHVSRITAFRVEGHTYIRGLTMTAESQDRESQFENREVSKLEDETNEDSSPRQQVDRIAEKLAEKSSKVEKKSGEDTSIFTK